VNNKKQEKDAVTFGALKAGSAEFFVRGKWGYIARKQHILLKRCPKRKVVPVGTFKCVCG